MASVCWVAKYTGERPKCKHVEQFEAKWSYGVKRWARVHREGLGRGVPRTSGLTGGGASASGSRAERDVYKMAVPAGKV